MMTYRNTSLSILIFCIVLLSCTSCGNKPEQIAPKPKGYFRIALPQPEYTLLDTTLPFTMDISQYAQAVITPKDSGKIWIDLQYPQFAAELKMTYFPMHNNMRERMVQEREMVQFHYVKADDVEYSIICDPESRMFGQIYDIQGEDVATPFQFWVSDSSYHFLRGSLYFNFPPNNDSIQPVIDYLRNDLLQMVNTLEWR
jgi:gliding motility-associated lipoprotein GldD